MNNELEKVLVVGGAGYVGSLLVPKLLQEGYQVRVFDKYIFSRTENGEDIFGPNVANPNLEQIRGDVRDKEAIDEAVCGADAVIHLACISNDPSFDLDPRLGRSINYLAFFPFLESVKRHHPKRLIYASSASVYGVKEERDVTEVLPLEPLTDYSLYKALCEKALQDNVSSADTPWVILRPTTVCGYARRQRLDVIVNILTNHAVNNGIITVEGGQQERPNIHIDDITGLYVSMLEYPEEDIAGQIFNVNCENSTVREIAEQVQSVIDDEVDIELKPVHDNRSYRVSDQKIRDRLGWAPQKTIKEGITDLIAAFRGGKLPRPLEDPIYYNIRRMRELNLT